MSEEKKEVILLKRDHPSNKLDLLLIVASFLFIIVTITLSSIYQMYMFIFACLLFLGLSFDAIHTMRMKKKNNHVIKDCINFLQVEDKFVLVDINANETSVLVKDVLKVKRDNLWTFFTYIYFKEYKDDGTYNSKKINLGYTSKKDFQVFADKLKTLIEISNTVEA